MSAEWVKVRTFSSGLDADLARAILESADILVEIRGQQPGIFGASFQGSVPGGLDLYVPRPEVNRALELLDTSD